MKLVGIIVIVIVVLIVMAVAYGLRRTYTVEHSLNQEMFRSGSADTAPLDGDYVGVVRGYTGSWQGKTFNKNENTGINRFKQNEKIIQKYPFKTYISKGLRDPNTDVITLDYNQPGNPWWLKYIVDEVISTAPNTYLGKVHIRVIPRLVFSMGYFTLKK